MSFVRSTPKSAFPVCTTNYKEALLYWSKIYIYMEEVFHDLEILQYLESTVVAFFGIPYQLFHIFGILKVVPHEFLDKDTYKDFEFSLHTRVVDIEI